ncbi:50S ribosomal protein L10 [Proteocatella sphenisci]|uniref:50S ribosomal protein L10 n=1 Tax=Proteocatella sphenisci TaxID=181070 RepID=UPI00048B4996|nr:50S ribosomal protein L10 [Proteocatella sphenisci]
MSKAMEIKQVVVDEIADKLARAQSIVVVNYKGLTVDQATSLRNKFREAGIDYKVYKNTLVRRAAVQVGNLEKLDDVNLVGTNAIAFGYEDAVTPAKIVAEFSKTCPALEFNMGYVEGEYYDAEAMIQISKIPSREELIAKLLGSLKAPVSNFVYMLDALAKQKEEQGA